MRLVVVGSSQLWPTPELVSSLAALIASLPPGSEVVTRGKDVLGRTEAINPLEQCAKVLAEELGHTSRSVVPGWGPSRDTVWRRDYDMIRRADRVVGFFMDDTDDPMGGGAGHVIHAAMQKGVPCEAWIWTASGLINVGCDDGDDIEDLPDFLAWRFNPDPGTFPAGQPW